MNIDNTDLFEAIETGCDLAKITDLMDKYADSELKKKYPSELKKKYPNKDLTTELKETESAKFIKEYVNYKVNGRSPLHAAAVYDSSISPCIQALIHHGADINAQDGSGRTPLHIAIHYNQPNNVKLLLHYDAKTNMIDNNGCTPLHYAVRSNAKYDGTIISSLIEHGAKTEIRNNDGKTPLYTAAYANNYNAAALLLKHGAAMETEAHCSLKFGKKCMVDFKHANEFIKAICKRKNIDCNYSTTPTIKSTMRDMYNSNTKNGIVDMRNSTAGTESTMSKIYSSNAKNGIVDMRNSTAGAVTVASNYSQNATASIKAICSAKDNTAVVLMGVFIPIGVIVTLIAALLYRYKIRNRRAVPNSLDNVGVDNLLLSAIEM